MEIDHFTRKMEAITLIAVMAFVIILCFFRINSLEKQVTEMSNGKTVYIECKDGITQIKIPEGYHFECDGKDLILTEN